MAAGELTRRVAVAIVGIPTIFLLLYFGGWILGVAVAALAALGAREVYDLAEAKDVRPFRWLGIAGAASLVLTAVALPGFSLLAPWAFGGVSLLAAVSLLLAMPARGSDHGPLGSVSVTVFGVLYVAVPLAFAVLLRALPGRYGWGGPEAAAWVGALVVVLPLAATWIGDSAAYFLGTAFGKAKIAPSISPNKSWVGAVAGLTGSSLAAAVWLLAARPWLPEMPVLGVGAAAAMGAIMGAGGQAGDFAESLLKREAGVKDSGTIFPGHGGVLDRLDALVFAFPAAYALLVTVEVFS
ncbi:MAG: phosphatidate cytidylyltransferase [Deltaproteobacteria bacterium]|nr:phosphatidate cytidylyltransferase [Deltaproteobacteria bacterium]